MAYVYLSFVADAVVGQWIRDKLVTGLEAALAPEKVEKPKKKKKKKKESSPPEKVRLFVADRHLFPTQKTL